MRGFIYKIVCDENDKFYIGSTKASLQARWSRHKAACKAYDNGQGNFCSCYDLINTGTAKIQMLEEYWCKDENELKRKEGEYQRKHRDEIVNIRLAGRTMKEWRDDNPDILRAARKRYYDKHQETILEKLRENYVSKKQDTTPKRMYPELKRYYNNKTDILKKAALKNITKFNRRPTRLTISKYEITEDEIQEALAKHQAE